MSIARQNHGTSSATDAGYIEIDEAEGIYIRDKDGRSYMDLFAGAGAFSIGHCHPKLVSRLRTQLGHHIASGYSMELERVYSDALRQLLPQDLSHISYFTTGAEAIEAALRVASGATNRKGLLRFVGGFHGKTMGALAVSDARFRGGFAPAVEEAPIIEFPGPDASWCEETYEAYIETSLLRAPTAGALLVEPIQGTAGTVVPPCWFMPVLRRVCDKFDILLIADEIITGFGRTGTMFASVESEFWPDILVVGKGMGGGTPLSAVLTSFAIASAVRTPPGLSSTFGGNALALAAGNAVLEIIKGDSLVSNAKVSGSYLFQCLDTLLKDFESLVNLRGRGLMIGFDICPSGSLHGSSLSAVARFRESCIRNGLIFGFSGSKVRLTPPINMSRDEIDEAVVRLAKALAEVF